MREARDPLCQWCGQQAKAILLRQLTEETAKQERVIWMPRYKQFVTDGFTCARHINGPPGKPGRPKGSKNKPKHHVT